MTEEYYNQVLRDELIDFLKWYNVTDYMFTAITNESVVDIYLKLIKNSK